MLTTIMFVFVGVAPLAVIFYCFRSTKEFPKNWSELKCEVLYQYAGLRGLIEDYWLSKYNRADLFEQRGRTAVVTGGNRGIGADVVDKLLRCKINVVLGVRNPKEAKTSLEARTDFSELEGVQIDYEYLDTGKLESVRQFAKIVQSKYSKVDLLINNAGIMSTPFELTVDGFESQLAINYLGHFYLTHLLTPQLRAAGTTELRSRVVNVSSVANVAGDVNLDDINMIKHYHPATAYNQSKLAQILFTRHLQDLIDQDKEWHTQVHSVHPGIVDTDLFQNSSTTYIPWIKRIFFKNTEEGARGIVYAAISPRIEGKGGSYLSNCVRVSVNSLAKNKELRQKLFLFTCELLKIPQFGK